LDHPGSNRQLWRTSLFAICGALDNRESDLGVVSLANAMSDTSPIAFPVFLHDGIAHLFVGASYIF